jgi:hypothetical protein
MLHVNGMQDQFGTVNRSQARRKRWWFAHYQQCIAAIILVTVIVFVRRAISSQLPDEVTTIRNAANLLGLAHRLEQSVLSTQTMEVTWSVLIS